MRGAKGKKIMGADGDGQTKEVYVFHMVFTCGRQNLQFEEI